MTPIRPVSDEHRHEPADYELEPNELAACPFCGSGDVHLVTNTQAEMSWVACRACGLETPSETGTSADNAVAYWNQRASLATRPKGDVREALERLTMRRHHHVASTDGDNCHRCQRDLRDPVHYRAGESHETDIAMGLTALTQAPRACCADERERAERIAKNIAAKANDEINSYDSYGGPEMPARKLWVERRDTANEIATAIRSNSHD